MTTFIPPPYYSGGSQGALPVNNYVDPSKLTNEQLMMLIGLSAAKNVDALGSLTKAFAQMMTDNATLQKGQTKVMTESTKVYMNQLQKYEDELNAAQMPSWEKWLNFGMDLLMALTQIENPVAFAAMITLAGLQAGGEFDKGGAIYNKMIQPISQYLQNKYGLSAEDADAIAQAIVITGFTLGAGVLDGVAMNFTKMADQATLLLKEELLAAAKLGADEALKKEMQLAVEQATAKLANRGLELGGVSFFKFGQGAAVTFASLVNTMNPITTGLKNKKNVSDSADLAIGIISGIVLGVGACCLGFRGQTSLLNGLIQKVRSMRISSLLPYIETALYVAQLGMLAGTTVLQVKAAKASETAADYLDELAPLDANMKLASGMMQVFSSLVNMSKQAYLAAINSRLGESTPDYASAWTAANHVMA